MSNTNNVSMYTKSTDTQSSNLGAIKSPGHKRRENLFINSFVGSAKGGVSYVKSDTRSTVSQQGDLVSSTLNTDIAVEGSGMLMVSKSANGEKVFTRRGDFQQKEDGYWKNGGGMLLLAWKLDNQGKLPADSTLLSSLEAVNFANVKGTPVATTIVSPAMNLGSEIESIRGAGVDAAMRRTGLNSTTGKKGRENDILCPEDLGTSGSLKLGDNFTFTSTPPGVAKTFTYGGFAVSKSAGVGHTIYGATSAAMGFATPAPGAPVAAGQVPNGAQISINGTVFSFVSGSPNADNKEFSSLANLATAINRTADLTAKIDANGRLYIAPKVANGGLDFEDLNGGSITRGLGLFDIPAAAANENRFYSLDSLEKAIKGATDASLKATIKDGNIKITSRLATADFTLTGSSLGVPFTAVVTGGTELSRAAVRIPAPAHGLVTGDLVRITGIGGQTPDGIYAVGVRGNSPDEFEIYAMSNAAVNTAVGGTLADGLPVVTVNLTTQTGLTATWQKTPGQTSPAVDVVAAGVTIAGLGIKIAQAHTLALNDVIFIRGFGNVQIAGGNDVSVPDGYYKVVAINGVIDFDIVASTDVAHVAAPALGNFAYQKVGRGLLAGFNAVNGPNTGTFSTNVMVTTGGVGSNLVKLFTSSNMNYSENDYISFTNLPAAGLVLDGTTVRNGVKYKVTANSAAGFVTFEVPDGNATRGDDGVNTPADIKGYVNTGSFQINNIGKALKYFGINQNQPDDKYGRVYNPDSPLASLAALASKSEYSDGVFVNEVEVYDSLGEMFALQFRFAKLDKETNKWAVSVGLARDADVIGIREDGQITAGTIEFDQLGKFTSYTANAGFMDVLQINRRNGSAASSITIDWDNALNKKTTASVTQYNGKDNSFEPYQQDGRASGILLENGLSVDEEGFIWGKFDTGEVIKLYQIPIAMFANVNGLLEGSDGTYTVTRDSGQALIKAAGRGGAGTVVGHALEKSNTDTTDQLLDVQEMSNVIRAVSRVVSVQFNNMAAFLSETKS